MNRITLLLNERYIYVYALERNSGNRMYFKKLCSTTMEGWQVQNLQGRAIGWRSKEVLGPGRSRDGCLLEKFPILCSLGEVHLFLLRPKIELKKPIHIMEGNLFHWVCLLKC
jgi:hypothetical protein